METYISKFKPLHDRLDQLLSLLASIQFSLDGPPDTRANMYGLQHIVHVNAPFCACMWGWIRSLQIIVDTLSTLQESMCILAVLKWAGSCAQYYYIDCSCTCCNLLQGSARQSLRFGRIFTDDHQVWSQSSSHRMLRRLRFNLLIRQHSSGYWLWPVRSAHLQCWPARRLLPCLIDNSI